MRYNMIVFYFRLLNFHVLNSAYFSTEYFITLILYRRSLDTFYYHRHSCDFRYTVAINMTVVKVVLIIIIVIKPVMINVTVLCFVCSPFMQIAVVYYKEPFNIDFLKQVPI